MRIRHTALLIATALIVGACGSGSSNLGGTNTQSGNGGPTTAHPAFRPIFQVGQGVLPYPTDLFLNGSTDGTVKAPVLAVTPNVSSLNSLDGFGVNTEMTVRFSKKVDASTLTIPGSVVVIETVQRTVIASASSIARVPVGVRRVLVPGVDYSIGLSTASDADGTVVSIKPMKPLTPSTGGTLVGGPAGLVDQSGVGYLVIVTGAVKSVDGDAAAADDDYALIRQAVATGTDPANPGSNCSSINDASVAGVCRLTAPQLAIAQAAHIPVAAVALTFSFTTESTRDTLVQMANAVLAGPAPQLAAQGLPQADGVLLTSKDLLDPTHSNPYLVGNADVYEGTITLPYYQPTPADATPTDPVPTLTGQWQAATAVSLVSGQAGSTRVTRYNPVPSARHVLPVPVLITVPNKMTRPEAGWPVVIFVHGITGNRSNMLAISEAYAQAGYAVAAIDLPVHGITPNDPAAALRIPGVPERTFDADFVNNGTGLPGPDGVVDGSGSSFIQVTSPITSRDNLRQAVIDQLALASALSAPTTVLALPASFEAPPLFAPFDPSRIQLAGQSLGGIVGGTAASLPSNIKSFALSVPGGGIADLLLQSATFGPPIGGAVAAKLGANTFLFNRMFGDAQAAVDSGDPLNHIAIATQNKPVLIHKVVNDQVIPNSATDRLIAQSGLTKYTAPGFGAGGGYVTFTAGAHASLLDPSAAPLVTLEMQKEFAFFAYMSGTAVQLFDGTYVQNP